MPASAQRHALELRLNSLEYQVPRVAGTVSHPARSAMDQRRDALAAEIAKQFVPGRPAQVTLTRKPVVRPSPPARASLSSLFDVPTLIVSLAAAGLLVGSALATMIWNGTVDAPWSDPASPPEERAVAGLMTASAAGKAAMSATLQQNPAADQPAQVAALPSQDVTSPENVEISAPDDAPGLFGDVRTVYQGDGQSGVEFGAIYDTPGSGPAQNGPGETEAVPDRPTQALVKEDPAAELAEPRAGADAADAKWIELPLDVNLRKGPSLSAGVIGVMTKGSKLQELERKRGWVRVIDPETSKTGWLYPNSAPKARRASKQPTPAESQGEPASPGPFARLGNLLGKPAAPSQPPPMR
jgi:uncharacterized protein YgiM (DUF1202 family)